MGHMTSFILVFILGSVAVQLGIAFFLIVSGGKKKPTPSTGNLAFNELFIDYKNIPPLKFFPARDGMRLPYRFYPASSDRTVILLHGSGWHSRYLFPLANFISSEGLAKVYTPDLRGHGDRPKKRGDIDYINQLEDDLADFIGFLRRDNGNEMIVVGGHSSGGGLAIRFAGSRYGRQADAYMLFSPWLKYNAPTIRPDPQGGWAQPYTRRIIGLVILNRMAIRLFNYLRVIEFNMPKEARDGTETLSYSYRLNTGYTPRNYKKDLRAIKQPLIVIAGSSDELFYTEKFESVISRFTKARVRLLPGVTHMGVVVDPAVRPVVKEWLGDLGKP